MNINFSSFKGLSKYFDGSSSTPQANTGLDIEPTSITLVEFDSYSSSLQIKHIGITGLAENVMSYDQIHKPDELLSALQKIQLESSGKSKNNVALTAPGTQVVTKQININQHVPPSQWETFAWTEARKLFPGMANNIYLDFHVEELKKDPNGKQNEKQKHRSMQLFAARKRELQSRLSAIRDADLTPTILDIDYYALARSHELICHQLPEGHKDKQVALLNIDSTCLLMVVIQNGGMAYCHRQNYNGAQLRDTIQQHLELAEPEDNTEQMPNQINAVQQIANHAQRFLQVYYSEAPRGKIEHLILSGRCAVLPDIAEHIEKLVSIPTTLANPFANIELPDHLDADTIQRTAPAYLLSCGLAMRGKAVC